MVVEKMFIEWKQPRRLEEQLSYTIRVGRVCLLAWMFLGLSFLFKPIREAARWWGTMIARLLPNRSRTDARGFPVSTKPSSE
ncbi:MAG TPA: hypothetical protein VGB55_00975 [Tepidisphaeraceae bacterium]|jgi:hypothetical protein